MIPLMKTTPRPSGSKDVGAQRGFTLVELAVVLVIIGLLIAAVLKGQELITSSRLKSTVGEVGAIRSAVTMFRDKYSALPGDYAQALNRLGTPNGISASQWPNCDGIAGCNGNGIVDGDGVGGLAVDETVLFWQHLAAANLVAGVDPAGTIAFGDSLPAAAIGGGLTVRREPVLGKTAHWLTLGTAADTPAGVVDSGQGESIDAKVDDGRPGTGDVRTVTAACTNLATVDATAEWNTTVTPGCVLKFAL